MKRDENIKDDLISRQEAFDEIIWNSDNGVIDAKVAIEALRKLPSVKPERNKWEWIPVNDKVPECDGYYLTSTMYGEVYCDYWSDNHFNRTETVLAWRSLPEPYKDEMEV